MRAVGVIGPRRMRYSKPSRRRFAVEGDQPDGGAAGPDRTAAGSPADRHTTHHGRQQTNDADPAPAHPRRRRPRPPRWRTCSSNATTTTIACCARRRSSTTIASAPSASAGAPEAASADLIRDLLPLVDDFERALRPRRARRAPRPIRRGVELIHKQLLEDILRRRGVQPIEVLGADFDPHLHEAVAHDPADGRRDGEIIAEFRRGYLLGQRLLRPVDGESQGGLRAA